MTTREEARRLALLAEHMAAGTVKPPRDVPRDVPCDCRTCRGLPPTEAEGPGPDAMSTGPEPPRWAAEFDASYAVPDVIADALPDLSWHNDACPSFGDESPDDHRRAPVTYGRLRVEHPHPARRESEGPGRFTVSISNERHQVTDRVVYQGDDPVLALRAYRRYVGAV